MVSATGKDNLLRIRTWTAISEHNVHLFGSIVVRACPAFVVLLAAAARGLTYYGRIIEKTVMIEYRLNDYARYARPGDTSRHGCLMQPTHEVSSGAADL